MSSLLPVYERDLVIVSGKGSRLTDSEGHSYLDFAAGIGVNGLGYGDRKLLAAIKRQAARLVHSSNLYYSEPVARLADRLASLAFPSRVFFGNSGTEAIEAAIKFARRIGKASGRTELVAFERAFHGRTMGALSLTWNEKYRAPFEPLVPDVVFRDTRVKLYGAYAVQKNAEINVEVVHDRTKLDEWTWGYNGVAFAFSDNTTVNLQPNQNVTFVAVRYTYRFR